ncbi:MAG: hypothetical protein IJ086_04535 [Clostridium sp.]|nr:hypothetical protein [Clostridium sp.]
MIEFIEKMIEKYKSKKELVSEDVHMNNILYIQKQCWRTNCTEEEIFKQSRKYLNKVKLTKQEHPFLYNFRNDLNITVKNCGYNRSLCGQLFNSFYEYKNKLYGKSKLEIV